MRGFVPALVLVVALGCGRRYLDDRTGPPLLAASNLEVVVDLDYPPGNIAVSPSGRIFFTLHPDGGPPNQLLELVDGKPVPYPGPTFQRPSGAGPAFNSVLSVRVDRQNRLWALDYARYGRGQPRIFAFDLGTNELVKQYAFPSSVAGLFSMLNDFQVDPSGEHVYIAEASPIRHTPAIVVYDVVKNTSRRLLESHPSVLPSDYVLRTPEREMILAGVYPLRIGIDSITLDDKGEWLYYGPVNGDRLYRVRTADLNDNDLDEGALGGRVEDYGPKTLSDGLSIDLEDRIYLTDPEHGAIVLLGPDRKLQTLVKEPTRLRWPDGLSFGPDGWLYVTCSSLQHVLFVSTAHMKANAPYQIFRLRPGVAGTPGH